MEKRFESKEPDMPIPEATPGLTLDERADLVIHYTDELGELIKNAEANPEKYQDIDSEFLRSIETDLNENPENFDLNAFDELSETIKDIKEAVESNKNDAITRVVGPEEKDKQERGQENIKNEGTELTEEELKDPTIKKLDTDIGIKSSAIEMAREEIAEGKEILDNRGNAVGTRYTNIEANNAKLEKKIAEWQTQEAELVAKLRERRAELALVKKPDIIEPKPEVKQEFKPDFEYANLDGEKRQERLETIFENTRLFKGKKIFPYAGYFFFPEANRKPKKEDEQDKADKDSARKMINGITKPVSELTGDDKEKMELLAKIYKIHLMPKEEYVPAIVEKILKAIEDDEELKKSFSQLKVHIENEEKRNESDKTRGFVMPIMVVYSMPGKENAQVVLDKICELFKGKEDLGINETPKLNQKVNNLVYYAQGDGGAKGRYRKNLEATVGEEAASNGGIFDPDYIHFKGDYKLKLPVEENKTKTKEEFLKHRGKDRTMKFSGHNMESNFLGGIYRDDEVGKKRREKIEKIKSAIKDQQKIESELDEQPATQAEQGKATVVEKKGRSLTSINADIKFVKAKVESKDAKKVDVEHLLNFWREKLARLNEIVDEKKQKGMSDKKLQNLTEQLEEAQSEINILELKLQEAGKTNLEKIDEQRLQRIKEFINVAEKQLDWEVLGYADGKDLDELTSLAKGAVVNRDVFSLSQEEVDSLGFFIECLTNKKNIPATEVIKIPAIENPQFTMEEEIKSKYTGKKVFNSSGVKGDFVGFHDVPAPTQTNVNGVKRMVQIKLGDGNNSFVAIEKFEEIQEAGRKNEANTVVVEPAPDVVAQKIPDTTPATPPAEAGKTREKNRVMPLLEELIKFSEFVDQHPHLKSDLNVIVPDLLETKAEIEDNINDENYLQEKFYDGRIEQEKESIKLAIDRAGDYINRKQKDAEAKNKAEQPAIAEPEFDLGGDPAEILGLAPLDDDDELRSLTPEEEQQEADKEAKAPVEPARPVEAGKSAEQKKAANEVLAQLKGVLGEISREPQYYKNLETQIIFFKVCVERIQEYLDKGKYSKTYSDAGVLQAILQSIQEIRQSAMEEKRVVNSPPPLRPYVPKMTEAERQSQAKIEFENKYRRSIDELLAIIDELIDSGFYNNNYWNDSRTQVTNALSKKDVSYFEGKEFADLEQKAYNEKEFLKEEKWNSGEKRKKRKKIGIIGSAMLGVAGVFGALGFWSKGTNEVKVENPNTTPPVAEANATGDSTTAENPVEEAEKIDENETYLDSLKEAVKEKSEILSKRIEELEEEFKNVPADALITIPARKGLDPIIREDKIENFINDSKGNLQTTYKEIKENFELVDKLKLDSYLRDSAAWLERYAEKAEIIKEAIISYKNEEKARKLAVPSYGPVKTPDTTVDPFTSTTPAEKPAVVELAPTVILEEKAESLPYERYSSANSFREIINDEKIKVEENKDGEIIASVLDTKYSAKNEYEVSPDMEEEIKLLKEKRKNEYALAYSVWEGRSYHGATTKMNFDKNYEANTHKEIVKIIRAGNRVDDRPKISEKDINESKIIQSLQNKSKIARHKEVTSRTTQDEKRRFTERVRLKQEVKNIIGK